MLGSPPPDQAASMALSVASACDLVLPAAVWASVCECRRYFCLRWSGADLCKLCTPCKQDATVVITCEDRSDSG